VAGKDIEDPAFNSKNPKSPKGRCPGIMNDGAHLTGVAGRDIEDLASNSKNPKSPKGRCPGIMNAVLAKYYPTECPDLFLCRFKTHR